MRTLFSAALTALLSLTLCGPAHAGSFTSLPLDSGKSEQLKIKYVNYTGGASGRMVIDLRNDGKKAEQFSAKGLFFVPQGDPEKAPQRLGAAGPFELRTPNQQWKQKETVRIEAGATVRLKLQVFCLDSHRSSPGAGQKFSVAIKRLPEELQKKIHRGAKDNIVKFKGNINEAKSAIQSHVWQTRNKKWIKLQGERAQEKAAPSKGQRRQRRHFSRELLNQVQQQVQQRTLDR